MELQKLPSQYVSASSEAEITSSNSSCVNGTYDEEVIGQKKGDRKMAKNPRDSWRKDELITGHHILINIYKGEDEMRKEVNKEVL